MQRVGLPVPRSSSLLSGQEFRLHFIACAHRHRDGRVRKRSVEQRRVGVVCDSCRRRRRQEPERLGSESLDAGCALRVRACDHTSVRAWLPWHERFALRSVPEGTTCPGGETATDLVTALPGFWRIAESEVSAANCPPQRQGASLPFCVYAVACQPSSSCLANNTCAEGYVGQRCALCDSGFFRANGSCAPCPSSPLAVVLGLVLLALAALAGSYVLNKSGVPLTLLSIGVDYAQARGRARPLCWCSCH